jgi:hypothetical protein
MSEVAICNQALGWVGGNLITSLGDSSNEARLCNANYADLRDAVLEDAVWSFAIKRARITKLVAAPEYGFASQFTLPSDTIRVLNVQDGGNDTDPDIPEWQREGNTIVCDRDVIYIKYIARITDTALFSSGFKQALAARIAADLSIPITQSRQVQSDMWSLYRAKLGDASTTDSLQGRSRRIRSRWVDQSRVGGGSNSMGPTV